MATATELIEAQDLAGQLSREQQNFLTRGRASLQTAYAVTAGMFMWAGGLLNFAAEKWKLHGFSLENSLAMAAVVVATGALLTILLVPFRKRVIGAERVYSAAPPPLAGGPPACRLCGADLPVGDLRRKLAPCAHCRAQNLITPDLLRSAGARVISSAGEIRAAMVTSARRNEKMQLRVLAAIVALFPATIAAGVFAWAMTADTLPRKFVIFNHPRRGSCIGRWEPSSDSKTWVTFKTTSGIHHYSSPGSPRPPDFHEEPLFRDATMFDGEFVETVDEPPRRGRVVRGAAETLVVDIEGRHYRYPARSLCMVERYGHRML